MQAALLAVYICRPGGNKDEDKGCVAKSMKFPEPKDFHPLPPFLSREIKPTRYYNVQFQILDHTRTHENHEALEPPFPNGRFGMQISTDNRVDEPKFVQFDPRCANFTAPLDSDEEWHISQNINANEGAPPFHVFHIHTNPFQVVGTERRGDEIYELKKYPEPIWQDSITIPDNEGGDTDHAGDANHAGVRVVIRRRVEDYTGAYVLHCHFLGHEDRGMMLTVQAVCPDKDKNYFSKTSSEGPECVGLTLRDALPPCPIDNRTKEHAGH